MDWILQAIDFVLHVDVYLEQIISQYGAWTYAILFFVVFLETGFVVTPFLPGDLLIFAASTFAARSPSGEPGALNPWVMFGLLSIAAVVGDWSTTGLVTALGSAPIPGK